MTPDLAVPTLAEPLGSFAGSAERGREIGGGITVTGRRVRAEVNAGGIQEAWAYPFRVSGPRIRGPTTVAFTGSVLGAERRLVGEGATVAERIVASRDAPILWVEWWSTGTEPTLELEWDVSVHHPGPVPVAWRALGPRAWVGAPAGNADDMAGPSGPRALFILSHDPEDLAVREAGEDGRGLRVQARVRVLAETGLRLAMVAARPEDDMARLLRVADRTGVAVRARAGAVDRVRQDGLSVRATDPTLGPSVERARSELALGPLEPVGPWTTVDLTARGLDHLAAGGFDAARTILEFLIRHLSERGRHPIRGLGPAVTDWAEPGLGGQWLPLIARYLAWTGDLAAVRSWWPVVREPGSVTGSAAHQLAAVAEDLGDARAAAALRRLLRSDGATDRVSTRHGGVIHRVVHELLGVEPDASRGRLVLRPRPNAGGRLDVRGLAVGSASVDAAWQTSAARFHLEVRQSRGAAPLQLVLEPEVEGRAVVGVRVDGRPAELDIEQVRPAVHGVEGAGRFTGGAPGTVMALWRVPVQLALDLPRRLDVDVEPG